MAAALDLVADKWSLLVPSGMLEKRLDQNTPRRYVYLLTEAGQGLIPGIKSMVASAAKRVDGIELPTFK